MDRDFDAGGVKKPSPFAVATVLGNATWPFHNPLWPFRPLNFAVGVFNACLNAFKRFLIIYRITKRSFDQDSLTTSVGHHLSMDHSPPVTRRVLDTVNPAHSLLCSIISGEGTFHEGILCK